MSDAVVSSGGMSHSSSAIQWRKMPYTEFLGHGLVLTMLLTAVYHATAFEPIEYVVYLLSMFILGLTGFFVWSRRAELRRYMVFAICLAVSVLGTIVANPTRTDFEVIIKFVSLFLFYAAGLLCYRPFNTKHMIILLILPFLFLLTGPSKVFAKLDEASTLAAFSLFPTQNVAVLYVAAIVFVLVPVWRYWSLFAQVVSIMVFTKVGIAIATVMSVVGWNVFPLRLRTLKILAAISVILMIGFYFGALDRAISVISTLYESISATSVETLSSASFGQIVNLTRSTDVSGFFRLIHWNDIWTLYTAGGPVTILFGMGAGQSIIQTKMHLEPHNDYLRVLAEFGLVNFLIFATFVLYVVRNIGDRLSKILFTVLLIYFFSENLMDNFASMALFFVGAGLASRQGMAAVFRAAKSVESGNEEGDSPFDAVPVNV